MAGPPGRSNGLRAHSYTALTDVDPHVADLVLQLLAAEEIAAYACPAEGRSSGQLVPDRVDRVLDRVYVDSSARARASALLSAHRAELDPDPNSTGPDRAGPDHAGPDRTADRTADHHQHAADEDAVWADLVAAFDGPSAADPVPRWPHRRDVEEDGRTTPAPDGLPDPPATPGRGRVLRPAGLGPGDEPAEIAGTGGNDDEEHFVPPPPPPLPQTDAINRWAWIGVLGAPVFFLVVTVVGASLDEWMVLLGIGAFVGGFVTLVARMKDRSPDDPDRGNGAVV